MMLVVNQYVEPWSKIEVVFLSHMTSVNCNAHIYYLVLVLTEVLSPGIPSLPRIGSHANWMTMKLSGVDPSAVPEDILMLVSQRIQNQMIHGSLAREGCVALHFDLIDMNRGATSPVASIVSGWQVWLLCAFPFDYVTRDGYKIMAVQNNPIPVYCAWMLLVSWPSLLS